jgi:cytochrome c oxidase subunit I
MTLEIERNSSGEKQVVTHSIHYHAPWKWYDYFTFNIDHKVIGIQYLVTAFLFYLIGGLMAMAIRVELATPDSDLLDPNLYNAFMTNHGTIMILIWITGFRGMIPLLCFGLSDGEINNWLLQGVKQTAS